jgi:hypothetical protein
MENREVKQVLSGGWPQWEGRNIRKGCRRVNMVEILWTHEKYYENEKMRHVEIFWGMEGGEW